MDERFDRASELAVIASVVPFEFGQRYLKFQPCIAFGNLEEAIRIRGMAWTTGSQGLFFFSVAVFPLCQFGFKFPADRTIHGPLYRCKIGAIKLSTVRYTLHFKDGKLQKDERIAQPRDAKHDLEQLPAEQAEEGPPGYPENIRTSSQIHGWSTVIHRWPTVAHGVARPA